MWHLEFGNVEYRRIGYFVPEKVTGIIGGG